MSEAYISHHPFGLKQDRLGYAHYANAICATLARAGIKGTGLTVGVFGDWGIGKSTILRMVKDNLEGRNDEPEGWSPSHQYLVVEFDAWRYTKQEELWVALLRRIVTQIERQIFYNNTGHATTFSQAKSGLLTLTRLNFNLWLNRLETSRIFWPSLVSLIIRGVAIGLLVGLALLVFTAVETPLGVFSQFVAGGLVALLSLLLASTWSTVLAIVRGKLDISLPALTRQGFDRGLPLIMDDFREDFRTVVETISKNCSFVVLIDDLDRCPFDQVVPVLEAIKHFGYDDVFDTGVAGENKLDRALITFVLAADRRAIERAVSGYYKDFLGQMQADEAHRFAQEYVEKIVQVPFDLPPLTRQKLEAFLKQA